MKKNQAGYINFDGIFQFLILIGIAIGFILFVMLPWLWEILKPWLHTLTA